MIGKSMRWERFSMKVNTDSRKVNTDSRKWGKSVHVQQESVFTFSRNGCSHWAGMGVQLQREYALMTAAAYVLFQELRLKARHTHFGRAQVSTIRLHLLKFGAWVESSVRRVVLHLPTSTLLFVT